MSYLQRRFQDRVQHQVPAQVERLQDVLLPRNELVHLELHRVVLLRAQEQRRLLRRHRSPAHYGKTSSCGARTFLFLLRK